MTSAATDAQLTETRLRQVLGANAAFSAVAGIVGVIFAGWVSRSFGIDHVTGTRLVSAGLIVFAIGVAWTAAQPRPLFDRLAVGVIAADFAWIILTIVFVTMASLSTTGVMVAIVQAIVVIDFGLSQLFFRARL